MLKFFFLFKLCFVQTLERVSYPYSHVQYVLSLRSIMSCQTQLYDIVVEIYDLKLMVAVEDKKEYIQFNGD